MRSKMVVLTLATLYCVVWAADNALIAPKQGAAVAPQAIASRQSTFAEGSDAITVPQMLSYQGKLTDTLGQPVPDGNYQLTFRLYTQPSGGSAIWTEGQTIQVVDGLFSALLGSVTPISSVPDGGALYLSLQVAVNPELAPRLRIASAAYAFLTARAADADLLQGKDTTGLDARYINEGQASSVTGAMLVDGTVLTADVGDTAVTMPKLARAGATTGQVVKWTGSAWAPGPDNTGGGSGVTNIYQDTGIICVPNPITSTGNVKLDLSYGDGRYVNEAQSNSVTSAMITDGNVTSADIRDTTVSTAELKDGAVTAPKINQMGATSGQVIKWTGSAWAPRSDSISGGAADSAWVRSGSDSVLYTIRQLGIARGQAGNKLWGNQAFTHVNLGVACTTGYSGQNYEYSTVGGGLHNEALGPYGTVAGGDDNEATGLYATISGGQSNTANYNHATVSGGQDNRAFGAGCAVSGGASNEANNYYSTVGGGYGNTTAQSYSTISGGYDNAASRSYAAVGGGWADSAKSDYSGALSGYSNLAGDSAVDTAATVCGGWNNSATGRFAFVGGGSGNGATENHSVVVGGYRDTVTSICGAALSGCYNKAGAGTPDSGAAIAGGGHNTVAGAWTFVGGGSGNTAFYSHSTVGGGRENCAIDYYATVGGGLQDTASADHATVGGGRRNKATADHATVSGGTENIASGAYAAVGGGGLNHAVGSYAVVGGGFYNEALATCPTIAGGFADTVKADHGVIGGGYCNRAGDAASDTAAVIAGGWQNTATGKFNFIGGGYSNNSSNNYSVIVGGRGNTASGPQASVLGGWGNTAGGYHSVVAGGLENVASGTASAVSGGEDNAESGYWSTIAGGRNDTCQADYALVSGYTVRARANADYTLAFGENCSTSVPRAVIFYHSGAATKLGVGVQTPTHYIDVTGGSYCDASGWHNPSSRELKRDITKLTPAECRGVLQQLLATDVARYKYRLDETDEEHIGLIAEEAPDVLTDPEHKAVGTGDAIGFLMAAVKAQQAEIDALKAELAERK